MKRKRDHRIPGVYVCSLAMALLLAIPALSHGTDLEDIQKRGTLIHIGVPYANFVTGSGDGLDVELMERFARYLGVKYQYVPSTWSDVICDLTGERSSSGADTALARLQFQ